MTEMEQKPGDLLVDKNGRTWCYLGEYKGTDEFIAMRGSFSEGHLYADTGMRDGCRGRTDGEVIAAVRREIKPHRYLLGCAYTKSLKSFSAKAGEISLEPLSRELARVGRLERKEQA